MKIEKPEESEDNIFYYDLDEATDVVWENISQKLRDKFSYEDIYFILEQEFDYLDSIGIMLKEGEKMPLCEYPRDINQAEMDKYIMTQAIKNDIFMTEDEFEEIMTAELEYYDMNGSLGDAGEHLN